MYETRGSVRSSEPRDHADVDRIALGNVSQTLARTPPLDSLLTLKVRQLALAPKLDAVRHRPLAPLARAFADQLTLKFGDGGQERRKQPPLRAAGVKQRV